MALLKGRIKAPPIYSKIPSQEKKVIGPTYEKGIRISIDQTDAPRKYKAGSSLWRVGLPSQINPMHSAPLLKGTPVPRLIGGIGALGLGYVPDKAPPTIAKPVRKYPRDWHGENM